MNLIKKTAEKTVPLAKKATQKAAPVTVQVMLKTGQVALKAGSAVAETGSKAIAKHTRKREEKEQALIDGYKKKYPGCRIFLSEFDPDDADFRYRPTLRNVTAFEIYDEYYAVQYVIEGNIAAHVGTRHLHVYTKSNRRIGSCTEHGIIKKHISIESGGSHIMDVTHSYPIYEFSDLRYSCIKEKSSKGLLIGREGRVLMETTRIKGYEVLVIVDPSKVAACMIIFAAMKLASIPRPIPDGGGA